MAPFRDIAMLLTTHNTIVISTSILVDNDLSSLQAGVKLVAAPSIFCWNYYPRYIKGKPPVSEPIKPYIERTFSVGTIKVGN